METITDINPTKSPFSLVIKLVLCLLLPVQLCRSQSAGINYGSNPANGHFLEMKDKTKIYYEIYGRGKPLVLIHGGMYGDISEYSQLIPKLSENFQVIAIDTRGHSRSEIGHQPFTYPLLAEDAFTVIKHVTKENVIVIGFSVGALTAITLTVAHPEMVSKLVFVGHELAVELNTRPEDKAELGKITGLSMEQQSPGFVSDRKKLMPEPQRWNEFVKYFMNLMINPQFIKPEKIKKVTCPVMVIGGDRDDVGIENIVATYKLFPNSRLAVIPNSGHVVFASRPDLVNAIIVPFVLGLP